MISLNARYRRGTLPQVVSETLKKREALLALETPGYVYDRVAFQRSINQFVKAFSAIKVQPFYAMKTNPHPLLLADVIKKGLGIDVSSRRELTQALSHKPKQILYTGPAKSEDDLRFALKHRDIVTINIDSFTELERLGKVTAHLTKPVGCGVRIFTKTHGSWNKFGIPLTDLALFWKAAKHFPNIKLCGIQTHMSFAESPQPYQQILTELAEFLKTGFTAQMRGEISFIDFGGGFWPAETEGYYPWDTPEGTAASVETEVAGNTELFEDRYLLDDVPPLSEYAASIIETITTHLQPLVSAKFFAEPGRILAQPSMHLLLTIMDIKPNGVIITDGGTNMVGWEKFETTYCPVINLTHPAETELPARMYGSLCTPNDMWGYYCYAEKMAIGDMLVIPNQGAYVYTYAQNFIQPIPKVQKLDAGS